MDINLLEMIWNNTDTFLCLTNTAGKILQANQAAQNLLGPLEYIYHQYLWKNTCWEDLTLEREQVKNNISQAAQGNYIEWRSYLKKNDQIVLPVSFQAKPLKNSLQFTDYILLEGKTGNYSNDIIQKLLDHAAIGVLCFDKDLKVRWINEAFCRMYTLSAQDFIGFDLSYFNETDSQISCLRKALKGNFDTYEGPCSFSQAANKHLYISLRTAPVFDAYNQIEGGICLIENITTRIELQKNLEENETKFREVFEHFPLSIALVDYQSGRFIDINKTFTEKLNLDSKDAFIGKTLSETFTTLDTHKLQEFYQEVQLHGKALNYEFDYLTLDGSTRTTLASSILIKQSGKDILLTVGSDITPLREYQQMLLTHQNHLETLVEERTEEIKSQNENLHQLNEELKMLNEQLEIRVEERTLELTLQNKTLSEYAFINSHLLRAPLSSILGIVELLELSEINDAERELIEALRKSAEKLDQVIFKINDLLNQHRHFDRERVLEGYHIRRPYPSSWINFKI